jgi:hypothetical protein
MSTHFHLVLDVPGETLQRGMQDLNWAYARRFNARHGRKGHLVGERYDCVPVTTNRQMLRTFRYVARNPVKAGLCENTADWYWSSYADCAWYGETFGFVDHSRMRSYFGPRREDAVEFLRAFVEI